MDQAKSYSLRAPSSDRDWAAYHTIRRTVLFERRGQVGVYDPTHPDETRAGNHPFLLWRHDEPIGTIRIDLAGGEAVFRRVAIREDLQGQGHGRRMLALAEDFVRTQGVHLVRSHVDPGAVNFYEKCGFRQTRYRAPREPVLMTKELGRNESAARPLPNEEL